MPSFGWYGTCGTGTYGEFYGKNHKKMVSRQINSACREAVDDRNMTATCGVLKGDDRYVVKLEHQFVKWNGTLDISSM